MTESETRRTGHQQAIDELLEDESREVVVLLDEHAHLLSVSERGAAMHRVFELDVDAIVGRSILDIVHPDDRGRCAERLMLVRDGVDTGGTEFRIGPPSGPFRYVRAKARLQADEHGAARFVALLRDIDDARCAEQRLTHIERHDTLTTLPNRHQFVDRLDEIVADRGPSGIAVLVINLDRFRYINDGLGTAAGDEVLVGIADRLRATIRSGDTLARLGADEFGIIGDGFAHETELVSYANRLRAAIREPMVLLQGVTVDLDSSIGIAFSPADELVHRGLLREADAAKNMAKDAGQGSIELSTGGLSKRASEHVRLERELRQAIRNGELCVHYQPQVDHRRGETIGVEALVRWNHPRRGLVPPGEFIPLAEESDLIVDIGAFVLEASCRQMAEWHRQGHPLKLSVNLAARQLVAPGFCRLVTDVLDVTGLDPNALTLEVTESTLFRDTASVTAVLECMHALGVHLALDDFGTGYSSLVYLRRFQVEVIKIDQSFVRGIGTDAEAELIIRGIINLARSLGIDLVAEGAERAAEADWLLEAGCDVIQGYLYSRPVPASELLPWLDATAKSAAIR